MASGLNQYSSWCIILKYRCIRNNRQPINFNIFNELRITKTNNIMTKLSSIIVARFCCYYFHLRIFFSVLNLYIHLILQLLHLKFHSLCVDVFYYLFHDFFRLFASFPILIYPKSTFFLSIFFSFFSKSNNLTFILRLSFLPLAFNSSVEQINDV